MKERILHSKSNRILIFVVPVLTTYVVWAVYMFATNSWRLFYHYFYMSITMIIGSFVAGGSSEGGGAIAFPVMTLIF